MELFILPILAILGLSFLLLGDDGGEDTQEQPDPDNSSRTFGAEDDIFAGEAGDQSLFMGSGDDVATGGEGDDRIFLAAGDDSTLSEDGTIGSSDDQAGDDFIRGGDGADQLVDGVGSNTIYGDSGWDQIDGRDDETSQGTADALFGGRGADVIEGDMGDVISGGANGGGTGAAFDRFGVTVVPGADPVTITDFEVGEQIVLRGENSEPLFVEDFATEVAENGEDLNVIVDDAVVLVLQGVTEIPANAFINPSSAVLFGTDGDDTIQIPDEITEVYSRDGDDRISFADGSVEATADRDMQINAGHGNDFVATGAGDDIILGNLGDDYIHGRGGFDVIEGGFGNDEIHSTDSTAQDGQADEVDGGGGDDTIYADDGDEITGGRGTDTFFGMFNHVSDDAVTITDFDPSTETLNVVLTLPEDVVPQPLTTEADGNNTLIKSGDRTLFILENVLAADVDTSGFTIVNDNTSG